MFAVLREWAGGAGAAITACQEPESLLTVAAPSKTGLGQSCSDPVEV